MREVLEGGEGVKIGFLPSSKGLLLEKSPNPENYR